MPLPGFTVHINTQLGPGTARLEPVSGGLQLNVDSNDTLQAILLGLTEVAERARVERKAA